jgi:hypothetical protein
LKPENLDAATRLAKILAKLDAEIKTAQRPTIFCLQEVSYNWAGAMHTFFGQRGYHVSVSWLLLLALKEGYCLPSYLLAS